MFSGSRSFIHTSAPKLVCQVFSSAYPGNRSWCQDLTRYTVTRVGGSYQQPRWLSRREALHRHAHWLSRLKEGWDPTMWAEIPHPRSFRLVSISSSDVPAPVSALCPDLSATCVNSPPTPSFQHVKVIRQNGLHRQSASLGFDSMYVSHCLYTPRGIKNVGRHVERSLPDAQGGHPSWGPGAVSVTHNIFFGVWRLASRSRIFARDDWRDLFRLPYRLSQDSRPELPVAIFHTTSSC